MDTKATDADILRRARSILEEKGWTQEKEARNAFGIEVDATYPEAACFCTIGAIRRAAYEITGGRYFNAYGAPAVNIMRDVTNGPIIGCNDDPTTKLGHVLMAFDFAILVAEEGL